mmetsp:Transcript_110018/g.173816  ORF Transcript_110018/g.173816 Transcript_110018/m.173816 type:complete len:204 (+) Transcript_110018:1550-2161(+)
MLLSSRERLQHRGTAYPTMERHGQKMRVGVGKVLVACLVWETRALLQVGLPKHHQHALWGLPKRHYQDGLRDRPKRHCQDGLRKPGTPQVGRQLLQMHRWGASLLQDRKMIGPPRRGASNLYSACLEARKISKSRFTEAFIIHHQATCQLRVQCVGIFIWRAHASVESAALNALAQSCPPQWLCQLLRNQKGHLGKKLTSTQK